LGGQGCAPPVKWSLRLGGKAGHEQVLICSQLELRRGGNECPGKKAVFAFGEKGERLHRAMCKKRVGSYGQTFQGMKRGG